MYNYYKSVKSDIIDYINENITLSEYEDSLELCQFLGDELWTVDSVTGNASGSYTFNRWEAQEYVLDNMDLLKDALEGMGMTYDEIGRHFIECDFEFFDVAIRCDILYACIDEAVSEIWEDR